MAQRRRAERVVDVVEAGEGEGDGGVARLGADDAQDERGVARAVQAHVIGADVRAWALATAAGAAVASEVAEVDGVVRVRVPTSAAVLRVGRMLHLRQGHRVVLDAEVGDVRALAPEVGDERVVRVQHEPRRSWQRGDDLRPALGDRLQLAVAVELVSEEVAEQQGSRSQLLDHLREPELVDLEQPELAVDPASARRLQQRRGDPARHVRAGAVVDERDPAQLEDRRDHRRRRRLAVRRGDHDRALRQPCRQRADRPRVEPHQQLARQRRAAAAPGGAREAADRARDRELRSQRAHGTITRTAAGRVLTVAGSCAIGSPSA